MLMQKNQAFEHAEMTSEAIHAGQSLSALFLTSTTELVPAGRAICWEGDEAKHLFQVVEGVVRLFRIVGEGRRVITAFQFAGDLIGASLQSDFHFTAEAVTECKIRRVSRKSFHDDVARSDTLHTAYISLLCRETAAAREQMVLLSKKNAEERLCSFITKLASRRNPQARQGLLRVPMNRQDIADHLGLTIETVSRAITRLASRNVVIPEGRHDLRIVDLARLTQLSGDADDFSDKSCHRVSMH
ncbi:Crp/Fnr family transcriptional regulator [Rhizobium leguminosarum]|uniref:Crp/Fnr family transcriptional regulator n=1 Tax=Rhizobium leguminosarum TaxID=384 RepID=UPI00103B0E61|nr:helix-turn-helix domain-containing protein [Rhizobium leguminosarum]TBY14336.1 cyclic nucleotide-binding domain-containing protein [Rhizobium leguminosarum bv. viciae]TBY17297.1 cyclic nucleotide-binding domain-containing protein [Rhizobium leguminosarum bv. viciae]TBY91426.1 cyclic nucleotide-binding domain-containing protein [Rhizobium leguminosarum bv. viciae]